MNGFEVKKDGLGRRNEKHINSCLFESFFFSVYKCSPENYKTI